MAAFNTIFTHGNMIHCTARGSIAHNFLRLKEGGIYSIKNFLVHPDMDEFRIIKHDTFMLVFDGATTIRKASVSVVGFLRYPFQLVDFDRIEPTNNKHLIAKLYLSSNSSMVIYDDENIPARQELKTENSVIESNKDVFRANCSQPKEGTLENVLIWARNRKNDSIFSSCYLFRNPFSSTTMGDGNPIRTLGDYSRPSHQGYRNTIELPEGNNVVPFRSDTIWLVENGCSFHGLRSEDPNQHLKDFLKLVDSLDFDGENKERTRLRPQNSATISSCSNNIIENLYPKNELVSSTCSKNSLIMASIFGSKSKNFMTMSILSQDEPVTSRSNDPRDFAKPVKAIALPQDVPSTSDCRLIEIENQVQCLMEVYLASTQLSQVNKITISCEIYSSPHDTQYCMEDPEQAFVDYASSRTDEEGGLVSEFMASQDARLSKFEADFKQQQSEMTNKIDTVLKAITYRIAGTLPSNMVKNLKLGTHPVSSAHSYLTMDPHCSMQIHSSINAITIQPKQQSDSLDDRTKANEEGEREIAQKSILTLLHHLIHQFHSSPKKFSNLIHSSNRSDWFPHRPTLNSFAPKRMMAT
uniref:Replication protein A 70 kDa DNA-binding subunit C-like n=1 Tax=Tanacetum cinerariifolium TaxID=118510 RepID=A0A6L2MN22_TANCI|nr:replication protein A 70 kDa DNA-binding subunit C-like [Tanacetum cinerariifolium]